MRRRLPSLPRTALVAVAGALALLALGFVWVRDSSIVAVRQVAVVGASGPDAPKVEAALRDAAQDMTTLHIDKQALLQAVDQYPIVDTVQVKRDLLHGLRITVLERRPVAVASIGGKRVPVTADGRVLRGASAARDLPLLDTDEDLGSRITDGQARRLLDVVAAAPLQLRRRAKRVFLGDRGLSLAMDRGPDLYFGTPDELEAKWLAVARVLADPTAQGARYVDVRVPERTAAGGLAPLAGSDQGADGTASQPEEPATATPGTADPQAQDPATAPTAPSASPAAPPTARVTSPST